MTDDPKHYREPHEDYPEGKPYEEIPDDPGLNQEALHGSGFDEHRSLPELARFWLSELAEAGLHQPAPDRVWPPKMGEPKNHVIAPPEGDLRPLRLGDHRQVFWIELDGPRTNHGYRSIRVLDQPLRTQTAVVSLLTVLEGRPLDVGRLREALADVDVPLERSAGERRAAAWWGLLGEEGFEWNKDLQYPGFRYVLALLKHYRPDFDGLPRDEQVGLVSGAAERMNALLAASRQFIEFLEYGSPGKDLRTAAENANGDVRAAVLKDVEGLTLLRIAEHFGLRITETQRDKGEHSTVREMVKRGRRMLEDALGKEGWRARSAAMRAEVDRFRTLSSSEKAVQVMVDKGVAVEEARRRVEEARRSGVALLLPVDPD